MEEIENLNDSSNTQWYHGFNSGCLVMSRLLLQLAATSEPIVWNEGDDDDDRSWWKPWRSSISVLEFPFIDT